MHYRLFIILILGSIAGGAWGQEARYRVEILVLKQVEYDAAPLEVPVPEDFSAALDFLTPVAESAGSEQPVPEQADAEATLTDDPAELADEAAAPEAEELLNAVVHVPEMGPRMQDAWRRLRLSGPLRPLQFLAWEQGSSEPFPILRIHDLDTILIEDPWAQQRQAVELLSDMDAVAAEAADEAAGEELPPPVAYYRLDGTASLSRSRFLHLRLLLEWREPEYGEAADALAEGEEHRPSSYRVHRLEQSRPVRTNRMEYFDGPVLGVLAWITELDTTVEADAEGMPE